MSARLRHIGRDLQSKLKEFFDTPLEQSATPIELLQAALDELEKKIQPAGRGRRLFPYDRVVVRISQPGADAVAVDAIFADLGPRLMERLAELKCESRDPIDVQVSVETTAAAEGTTSPVLTLECFTDQDQQRPRPGPARSCPSVTITVVKGQCAAAEYVFLEPVIAIGRTAEPADALGQVRFNHVAFEEARDGITETVGRAHARLQFDPESGRYHLFNEGSSNPTSIIRGGRTIRVAPRDPRGVRVQSGDQLQLGRAVLRITIAAADDSTGLIVP